LKGCSRNPHEHESDHFAGEMTQIPAKCLPTTSIFRIDFDLSAKMIQKLEKVSCDW
jgi:hypothetical protein